MNTGEVRTVLTIIYTAHDRAVPDGLADIWAATLADVPYTDAQAAVIELLKTCAYPPKVAEVREQARLIAAERQRAQRRRLQIEARGHTPPTATRTGPNMVRHVLAALKAAGQDTSAGRFLGKERAGDIAETASAAWLERSRSEDQPPTVYRRWPRNGHYADCPNPERDVKFCSPCQGTAKGGL